MKRCAWAVMTSLVLSIPAWAGEGLGKRVVWDALAVPADSWETATGVTVSAGKDQLVLQTGDVGYGWATVAEKLPVTATTEVLVDASENLTVQLEWFRGDGEFISATKIAPAERGARKLAALLPEGERPAKFRFKFWLEGGRQRASLRKCVVSFERAWRLPGTKLVRAFDVAAATQPDAGLTVKRDGEVLVARVDEKTDYAAFAFTDHVKYDKNGVVLFDLAGLEGGVVTVQVLCWTDGGDFLKAVDLIKDMGARGNTEVALAMRGEDFPPECRQISFKVWVVGRGASARVAGLFYGAAP